MLSSIPNELNELNEPSEPNVSENIVVKIWCSKRIKLYINNEQQMLAHSQPKQKSFVSSMCREGDGKKREEITGIDFAYSAQCWYRHQYEQMWLLNEKI